MNTLKRTKQSGIDASLVFMPAEGGLIGVELYKAPIMLERKYVSNPLVDSVEAF
jgi:hypothetical protein